MVMTYEIKYADTPTACTGPKEACIEEYGQNRTIDKDELMFGQKSQQKNRTSTQWRHWKCCTDRLIINVKGIDNLEGFDSLDAEDQTMVRQYFKDVADAKKKAQAEKEANKSPKRKKKKAQDEDDDDIDAAGDQGESEEPYEEEEEAPPKKKGGRKKN